MAVDERALGPLSPYHYQLVEQLREDTGWSKHTVITMLSRLEAKGAVRHEEGERAKQFYPILDGPPPNGRKPAVFFSACMAAV